MNTDYMLAKKKQAHSKPTSDVIITPLGRLVGGADLQGRVDSFVNVSEATGYSPVTIALYKRTLSAFVKFLGARGVTQPEQVTEDDIVAYLLFKKETCGGVSINTFYRQIYTWFNWMLKRKIIKASPFAELQTPPIPRTLIKPLTGEQVQRMLDCCTDYFSGTRDKALILLIYDSGLRRSEVAGIQLKDIDLKSGAIKVMGKGAKERLVAIGSRAKQAVIQYLLMREDELPWLFVTHLKERREGLAPRTVSTIIQRVMTRAGITGIKKGPHTLRHSFATTAIRNGANLFYVQSLLGHSTLDMTRRYAATVDSEEAVRQHKSFSPADRLNKSQG